jgi:hypothetical protein
MSKSPDSPTPLRAAAPCYYKTKILLYADLYTIGTKVTVQLNNVELKICAVEK